MTRFLFIFANCVLVAGIGTIIYGGIVWSLGPTIAGASTAVTGLYFAMMFAPEPRG